MAEPVRVNRGMPRLVGGTIENGIPYGEQLHKERDALDQQYGLMPQWTARLRAATRKALGRG